MFVARTVPLFLAGLAFVPAAFSALAAVPAMPAAAPSAEGEVRATISEFVAALNAFDRERFARLFAEDATIFFPGAPFPIRRVEGKAQVIGNFERLFALLRGRGIAQGNVAPRDLRIQLYGETAIVTFHLAGGEDVGRRTLVLARIGGRWLIVHMHASSLREPALAPAPPPVGR